MWKVNRGINQLYHNGLLHLFWFMSLITEDGMNRRNGKLLIHEHFLTKGRKYGDKSKKRKMLMIEDVTMIHSQEESKDECFKREEKRDGAWNMSQVWRCILRYNSPENGERCAKNHESLNIPFILSFVFLSEVASFWKVVWKLVYDCSRNQFSNEGSWEGVSVFTFQNHYLDWHIEKSRFVSILILIHSIHCVFRNRFKNWHFSIWKMISELPSQSRCIVKIRDSNSGHASSGPPVAPKVTELEHANSN